jgi:hypothetical protein
LESATSAAGGTDGTCHYYLLPFIEQNNLYQLSGGSANNVKTTVIKTFICPSDPTNWMGVPGSKATGPYVNYWGWGQTNYYDNIAVFNPVNTGSIVTSMPNGTSNTVCWAEHVLNCSSGAWPDYGVYGTTGLYTKTGPYAGTQFRFYDNYGPAWAYNPQVNRNVNGQFLRRIDNPVFGCPSTSVYGSGVGGWVGMCIDYTRHGNVGIQAPAQVGNCDPHYLASFHPGGIVVGLGDGSVRLVSQSISKSTWLAVCYNTTGIPVGPDW